MLPLDNCVRGRTHLVCAAMRDTEKAPDYRWPVRDDSLTIDLLNGANTPHNVLYMCVLQRVCRYLRTSNMFIYLLPTGACACTQSRAIAHTHTHTHTHGQTYQTIMHDLKPSLIHFYNCCTVVYGTCTPGIMYKCIHARWPTAAMHYPNQPLLDTYN